MKKKVIIHFVLFFTLVIFTYGSIENPYTLNFIQTIKSDAVTASKVKKVDDESLYNIIKEKANEYYIPPKDAEIHKVWKATPGYNGRKVDVDKSFKKMKESGRFVEDKLIFKEIPPKITLNDLDASPIYRGHPDKKMVSFIVNVAWGNEYIPQMLKTFKDSGVKATFFLEGNWVKKNPELAQMIVEAGHEIGNHSYSHPNMAQLSRKSIEAEISRTNEVIEAATKIKPKWFGPPSGSFNNQVVEVAHELNMKTVLWSVDTIDWKQPEPAAMVNRVTSKLHNGAMILMHPTSSTAEGLQSLIDNIKDKEYKIGTLSILLSEKRISSLD